MKVQAKCTAKAWDGRAEANSFPSLCLPGEVYEIPDDGYLASMKIGARYIFEFDRNATRTNDGALVAKDYSCKKCGEKFDSLAEIGRHANAKHRDDELITEQVDESKPVVVEKRGKKFTCKQCQQVFPNPHALGVHKKSHAAETVAVPA